jgi:hypothetical protein
MSNAYFFAAKGIQRYILDGGKLRDMAGASELVARLCRSDRADFLEDVLRAANFTPKGGFSRRAGGVFMLHYDKEQRQDFECFRGLWRLVVSLAAPGLEFVDASWQGLSVKAAREVARDLAAIRQNSVGSLLPMAAPIVQRAQRTGLAAVDVWREPEEELEALDVVTLTKRKTQRRAEKPSISAKASSVPRAIPPITRRRSCTSPAASQR